MMRTVLISALLIIGVAQANAAEDTRNTDPTAFINQFSQVSIDDILNANIDTVEKTARFRTLFNDSFDIPAISRFVLGRAWRRASDAEKQDFLAVFEDVIVYTWSRRFRQYMGQTIKVLGTSPDGDTGTLVDSVIVHLEGQTISVQWRLRQRGEGLRIVDIIIEGISMVITYRQDYTSVIRQNGGIQGLLTELRKQAAEMLPSKAP
ncbi:MAG: ABC transporter substrate-binding protein [Rhodospirillaceae bacterium]|nr:ABC transporter substrate-binding protein [Rhodospirillaceae bacterium]